MKGLALGRVRLSCVARAEALLRRRYLHPAEDRRAAALAVDKRRIDFVAGRVAVKRALARIAPGAAPTDLAVVPDEGDRAGAPVVLDASGRRIPLSVSISHGAGMGCAVAAPGGRIGLDVERIEPRLEGFVEGAFAPGEVDRWARALGGAIDDRAVTVAWCAKEALLKVAGVGLRAPLESHAAQRIRWIANPPARAAARLDLDALAWAEIETEEVGPAALGVATREDAAMVIAWTEG